jgi:hypothetical protein
MACEWIQVYVALITKCVLVNEIVFTFFFFFKVNDVSKRVIEYKNAWIGINFLDSKFAVKIIYIYVRRSKMFNIFKWNGTLYSRVTGANLAII